MTQIALSILTALIAYQLVWGWIAAPLLPDRFAKTRIDAQTIEAVTRTRPYTIFAPLRLADPVLAYLVRPVQYVQGKDLAALAAPAYLLADQRTADMIGKARSDLAIVLHATIKHKSLGLFELTKR